MFLDAAGDGSFFGDVPWWIFPLVGIPMMLVMMAGMGIMMRMMMGMGGMGSRSASHGPADAPQNPTSDQASEAEMGPFATQKLRELKRLLDDGVITQSEFEAKKAELLREL